MNKNTQRKFCELILLCLLVFVLAGTTGYIMYYLFASGETGITLSGQSGEAAVSTSQPSSSDKGHSQTGDEGSGIKTTDTESSSAVGGLSHSQLTSGDTSQTTSTHALVPHVPQFVQSKPSVATFVEGSQSAGGKETPSSSGTTAEELGESGTMPKEIRIPDVPLMFDPMVLSEEEAFFSAPTTPEHNDDYFSDFYVQGEDQTLSYDDGLYFLDLYINNELTGSIEVKFEGANRLINKQQLDDYLQSSLTDAAHTRIFMGAPDYIDSKYLENLGVECTIDDVAFTVHLLFGINDMPERTLSVTNTRSMRQQYTLSGSSKIDPAFFTWVSSFNLYGGLTYLTDTDYLSMYGTLSSSNYLTIGGIGLDFYYSMTKTWKGDFNFSWNSYRFFKDFTDDNIRLSWGNIYGYTLSPLGTSVGMQFEKNYSYGTGTQKSNQYQEILTVTRDSLLEIESEGKIVYSKTFTPGNYRLKDFVFNTGYNVMTIRLTPLDDPSNVFEKTIELAYDSQLLAFGETLYGGSVAFGRTQIGKHEDGTGFTLQVAPTFKYDYHFDDFAVNYWQNIGLTDSVTLKTDFAVAHRHYDGVNNTIPYATQIGLSLVQANRLGTTTYRVTTGLGDSSYSLDFPKLYTRIDHRFIIKNFKPISSLSGSISYSNPSYVGIEDKNQIAGSLAIGGALGFLRYSVTGTLTESSLDWTSPAWSLNGSIGFSPIKNMSISTSMSAYKNEGASKGTVSASITLSYTFGRNSSLSATSNFKQNNSLTFYTRLGKNRRSYMQTSINNFDFKDPSKHTLLASYSYSGDLFGMSLRGQAYNKYKNYSASVSLSTSFAYAGGVLTMARSIGDNFMIIKPTGSIKSGKVSAARSMDNKATELRKMFGASVYTGITTNQRNNLVAYVTGKDSFANTETFTYELNPRSRAGYVVKVSVPPTYTVSAIIRNAEGAAYENFSSPLYRYITHEDGSHELMKDPNLYLFSDLDGRFIISDLEVGTYFFDIQIGNDWYAVYFEVPESKEEKLRVYTFNDLDLSDVQIHRWSHDAEGNLEPSQESDFAADVTSFDYAGVINLVMERSLDSETFWNEIFPPFTEDATAVSAQ